MRDDRKELENLLAVRMKQLNMTNKTEIRKQRLPMVLEEEKIKNDTFDELNSTLSLNPSMDACPYLFGFFLWSKHMSQIIKRRMSQAYCPSSEKH